MLRLASVIAIITTLSGAALAETATPNTTITIEPILLVLPMVDATIEYQPTPHLGIAVRGGYGRLFSALLSASLYEVGGQANVYLTRSFSGWHFGSEAFWLWGDSSSFLFDVSSQQMPPTSAERVIGVYAGYKWIGWHGLTGVIQFGVGHFDQKQSPDGPISQVLPVANMNAGWSF